MLLLVVEDCHAERELRSALESARTRGARADVLTGDALLAMRLRREGHAVRLTIHQMSTDAAADRDPAALDARDRIALDGVTAALAHYAEAGGRDFGPYLQYTLIPFFMRAVRNVTAVQDALDSPGPQDPAYARIVLVGGGPLVQAAGLVAERRGIAIEVGGGDLFQRATQAFARMKAGRATRWVNTGFRALVLEPGFIWLLFLKGLWRRIGGARPEPRRRAIIVVGDRFTADVIERVRGQSRPLVLAGATPPGRALFDDTVRLEPDTTYMPLEAFTELADPLRWIGAVLDAIVQAFALAGDAAHGRRFTVAGVAYWPLVARSVWLHILAWIPALRHLQSLAARAAYALPDARLLTSSDVTAYNRVLIDTVRGFGAVSLGIQHGMTGEPNGHVEVQVDELAVWGTETHPWFDEHADRMGLKRPTARFVVTGNPRFDALALRPLAISPKPSALFTVTICTGFVSDFSVGASEYENLKMIDEVLAWAKPREDVRVIHKIHPGEELEYYVQAGRALGWDPLKLTTIREPILYDVLDKSDVLVAAYSTTVLESLVLGTPAIVFDAMVQRKLLPLDRVPGVTIAYSIEELHQQLDTRRAGPAPDRQALRSSAELRAYISDLDGHATERVAALLQLPSDPSAPV